LNVVSYILTDEHYDNQSTLISRYLKRICKVFIQD